MGKQRLGVTRLEGFLSLDNRRVNGAGLLDIGNLHTHHELQGLFPNKLDNQGLTIQDE